MATTTRKRRPARKTSTTQAKTTTKTASTKTNGRKQADEATVAERRDAIQSRVLDGGESAAVVGKDLGITAGKAAFIAMQLRVESGDVPKISSKNDEQLIARTVAARDKADQFSSWGWLSARTGVAENTLKAKVEAAGQTVKGTKIASVRKANRPTPAKSAKTTRPAKKAAQASGKSTRTRTRRSQADPS